MKQILAAGFAGILFGIGLVVGQMTVPARVIGFLDFFGDWDPTLLFVMVGAIGVHLPLRRWLSRRQRPMLVEGFSLIPAKRVDAALIVGSAIFGIGWGLGGYCPAPAIANSLTSVSGAAALGSMLLGILCFEFVSERRARLVKLPTKVPTGVATAEAEPV